MGTSVILDCMVLVAKYMGAIKWMNLTSYLSLIHRYYIPKRKTLVVCHTQYNCFLHIYFISSLIYIYISYMHYSNDSPSEVSWQFLHKIQGVSFPWNYWIINFFFLLFYTWISVCSLGTTFIYSNSINKLMWRGRHKNSDLTVTIKKN